MVKKKAGGGATESKKSVQKKKQLAVEDKTFGLKNKNKSKKVQQHINSVTKNVMNSGDPKMRKMEEERAKAKAERKARAKAAKEEQEALFGAALMAVQKKVSTNKKEGKVEATGRDANDESNKKTTSRAMKMMFQMDASEMSEKLREDPNYVPTLEDEIEEQRQQKVAELKASGTPGTKVTPETFAAWQARKKERRSNEARKMVEAEMKKKKGGKGLSILSGRDLYEYKRDLFKDQDDDEEEETAASTPTTEEEQATTEEEQAKQYNNTSGETKEGVTHNEICENNTHPTNAFDGENKEQLVNQVQPDLFLEGDDDDLDDLQDD